MPRLKEDQNACQVVHAQVVFETGPSRTFDSERARTLLLESNPFMCCFNVSLADPGGTGFPGLLALKIFSKSCSFQAILWDNPLF